MRRPIISLNNYEEATEFLKTTDYIHSDHFKEYKGDTFPNLEMPWHLELEYWIDQNGYHDHFLILKSKPKREYPKVVATDRNSLPGDDEEKMMDFDYYLPGTRIDESWFKYAPEYLARCSYEFVGFKKYYFERDLGTEDKKKLKRDHEEVVRHESAESDYRNKEAV